MTDTLPPSASVAQSTDGVKLSAPSALRNVDHLTQLLTDIAPTSGSALELASGTGQHVTAFAEALPGLMWHPSEVADDRRASIDAYRAESGLANLAPARALDACATGWGSAAFPHDLILCINLLHLIPDLAAQTLVREAATALGSGGTLVLYGPFKRNGILTSDGDARFDAQLRGADPMIGYKDDSDISAWLITAGLEIAQTTLMPANNLAFIARKPA